MPPTNVDTDGVIRSNDSVREVMLDPTSASLGNGPAILGRHFFQAAYLMVDYETKLFTLWNANTTATENNLVALNNCTIDKESSSTISDTATTSQGTAASTSADAAKSRDTGLSTGTIAGIAIGGACAAISAAAAAVVAVCLRRRKKGKPYDSSQFSSVALAHHHNYDLNGLRQEAMSAQVNELNGYSNPSELPSDWKAKHELDAQYWRSPKHTVQRSPAELGSP